MKTLLRSVSGRSLARVGFAAALVGMVMFGKASMAAQPAGSASVTLDAGVHHGCVFYPQDGNVNCFGVFPYPGSPPAPTSAGWYGESCFGWNVNEPNWVTSGTPTPHAGGHYAMCMLMAEGTVDCMNNSYNEVGQTRVVDPVTGVPVVTDAVDVDGQFDRTCAALSNGDIRCWGRNLPTNGAINQTWTHAGVGAVNVTVTEQDVCYSTAAGRVACIRSPPDENTGGRAADSDNDGVPDDQDVFPDDPNEREDGDGDGVGSRSDNCATVANTDQANSDTDGAGDACDPDDDNDGLADGEDPYVHSDHSPTVTLNGVNTGVANREISPGATLADALASSSGRCGAAAKNHGAYVSCMSHALNALRSAGAISGAEKGQLLKAIE